ncbi:MAG: hypothetical protein HZB70_01180 [Candidatus Berkelbacteria bacterium]|nr:MAG: hypothetical protein HZB70_01180 [Candidatus Berkelbacteria bacterium]QQG52048.1 MAG: hypothetical protein HY845_01815 [Candidatus Berkelbacteria bacterium]
MIGDTNMYNNIDSLTWWWTVILPSWVVANLVVWFLFCLLHATAGGPADGLILFLKKPFESLDENTDRLPERLLIVGFVLFFLPLFVAVQLCVLIARLARFLWIVATIKRA